MYPSVSSKHDRSLGALYIRFRHSSFQKKKLYLLADLEEELIEDGGGGGVGGGLCGLVTYYIF